MSGEEKLFENKVKKWLKDNNIWYFKVWGGLFQKAGIPDIIGCCNGRFIALEIKASNGKPSKLQIYVIEQIQKSGGYAKIVYPDDFEDLVKDLSSFEAVGIVKEYLKC